MTKHASIVAAIVLGVFSVSSYAWWDNNWTDDFFGDGFGAGDFDFGFSLHGRGHGDGHGYGYNAPYWGYAPYYRPPYYAAPAPALTEAQQAAMAEQQKTVTEQQQKAFQQAVAAQREFAERLNREMRTPAPELPADITQRMQEHKAQREAMIRDRESRLNAAPMQSPRSEELKRQREQAKLRRTEMLNKMREQRNTVLSQPDKEM